MQTTRKILSTCNPNEAMNLLYPAVQGDATNTVMPIALSRDPNRTGGWFAFYRKEPFEDEMVPVVEFAIGFVSGERFAKYQHFAREKAVRLGSMSRHGNPDHIASWQSRDDSDPDTMRHKYGGAILVSPRLIFSFSGFSEHEDEMLCALVAHYLCIIGITGIMDLRLIATTSGNVPLHDWLNRIAR